MLRPSAVNLTLLLTIHSSLAAQATRYVPLDDPELATFEHLIARGVVADPAPFVRPFTEADALGALAAADTAANSVEARAVRRLIALWSSIDPSGSWAGEVGIGVQSFTEANRDHLRPIGDGGTRLLADVRLSGMLGPVVAVTRPTIEQRVVLDPDWTGNRVSPDATCCRWRFPEAYLSYQQGVFRLFYGRHARNVGPIGIEGVMVSDVAYPRDEIALTIKSRQIHLSTSIAQLDDVEVGEGDAIRRWHFTSRLGVNLADKLHLAVWQALVAEGPSRELEGPLRNPLLLLPLANQFGSGDRDNNVMIGVQGALRIGGGITLQAELVLDDLIQRERGDHPDRWAATLAATGPGPWLTAWRALYTRATSLAFRTADPNENYTEQGVGLGRRYSDGDRAQLTITRPIMPGTLAGVTFMVARQGEGRLDQPTPTDGTIPGIFIGTIERTVRMAGNLVTRQGPLELRAELGVNRVTNPDHIGGSTTTSVHGRLTAQLRLGTQGSLR